MAKPSKAQKETIERVMHEFKEGELKIRGTGPRVKNPKQAIAIALREAGASDRETPKKNREALKKTKAKERRSEIASSASGGRSKKTASPRERLGRKPSQVSRARTRAELYAEAKRRHIPGRSRMSKSDLERALSR